MSIKAIVTDISVLHLVLLAIFLSGICLQPAFAQIRPEQEPESEQTPSTSKSLEPLPPQGNCKIEINSANDNFEIGRVNNTIRILQPCVNNALVEKDDKIEMYRLLSLSHLARRDTTRAYTYVQDLIRISPRYKSRSIEDDPQFQIWVDALRPKWHERWLWRGVMAGGVAGAIIGYRALSADDQPLPFPPTGPQ